MTRARNLARHMTETVQVYDNPGVNHRGERDAFGLPREYKALVEWKEKLLVSAAGENIVSRARVFIKGAPGEVNTEDWVVLPDGDERQVITISHWSLGGFLVLEV